MYRRRTCSKPSQAPSARVHRNRRRRSRFPRAPKALAPRLPAPRLGGALARCDRDMTRLNWEDANRRRRASGGSRPSTGAAHRDDPRTRSLADCERCGSRCAIGATLCSHCQYLKDNEPSLRTQLRHRFFEDNPAPRLVSFPLGDERPYGLAACFGSCGVRRRQRSARRISAFCLTVCTGVRCSLRQCRLHPAGEVLSSAFSPKRSATQSQTSHSPSDDPRSCRDACARRSLSLARRRGLVVRISVSCHGPGAPRTPAAH
jgi:hypothetical protein